MKEQPVPATAGIRKPDLICYKSTEAVVLDTTIEND